MELTPEQFEKLLCEFCKQDLPEHFTVEHDIKDIGEESGNNRQIDVKIKGRIGISDILICGEAKNWKTPVGSEIIDALVGKYLSGEIRANKIILFSNNGFTDPAITRAKHLGIELLEPKKIGVPIEPIPAIVAIGYLGQMIIKISSNSRQANIMSVNPNDYIIIKGSNEISFQQNIFRKIVNGFKAKQVNNIHADLSKVLVEDKNVLYEFKDKVGFRYNSNFKIDLSLVWDYFYENLPTGVLHHINSGQTIFVNLQGTQFDILKKVMYSPTKGNYEDRIACIENVVNKNIGHTFLLCLTDPDRHITHPEEPIFSII
jgi:hypothetical protein